MGRGWRRGARGQWRRVRADTRYPAPLQPRETSDRRPHRGRRAAPRQTAGVSLFVLAARKQEISMGEPATVFLMYHEIELPQRQLCQSDPGYARYVISIDEFKAQIS